MTTLKQKLLNAAKDFDRQAAGYLMDCRAYATKAYLDACDMRDLLEDAARRIEQLERTPDANCYTLPNGDCIGSDCIHDVR